MHYQLFTRRCLRGIAVSLIFTLALSAFTLGQDKKQDEKKNQKPKQTKETTSSFYKKWVDEDVRWIITDEERKTFNSLKTDEEREQFIEQFWLRRDPDPDTDSNEYKEEYFQRIAYSNEHFTSGIPGWKTDRGRIYVMFGKPDQKESHPSGGGYDRPTWEGGGRTTTYPFEIWWYRYIEGVGSDVEIEFVDPTGTGEYRIARSPDEKDALLYVPGAGLTLAEELGLADKGDRIAYGNRGSSMFGGQRAKDNQFDKLDLLAKLQKPPSVKFNDLAAYANESEFPKITFDALPVNLYPVFLRVTDTSVITSFTVQMDNKDLVYKDVGGIQQAAVNIYAKVTRVSGRREAIFEDVITSQYTTEALQEGLKLRSVYEKKLVLPPGIYKIDLVARDTRSGKTGVIHHGFTVPRYPEGELTASTPVLASRLESLVGRMPTGMFVYGSMKVIPNATADFRQDQTLGIYMQVYNVAIDQATLRPSLEVEYLITQKDKEILRLKEDGKNSLSQLNNQQVTLARLVSLKELKPGSYEVTITVKDNVAGKTITRKDAFQVVPAAQ